MEDDVQSQAEETALEETQEQTTVTEDYGSEAAQTQSDDADRGDLRVALKKEREEFRRKLNDPNFVYERARALGLAQGEEPAPAVPQAPLSSAEVRIQIRAEKAREKYPELTTDRELQLMADALVNAGMDPLEAADSVFSRMRKTEEKAKVEAVQQAKAEVSERERAQMAGTPVRTNSNSERLSEIQRDMRSPNKAVQEAATLEWLKLKNTKDGVI